MDNKNEYKVEAIPLRSREQIYYILLIFGYLLIGIFGYFFHQLFVNHNYKITSAFFIIFFPLILITYSKFYHINFQKTHSDKQSLDELEKELQNEKASTSIPVILFGLGILLTRIGNKKTIKMIVPYLLASLFFGTVATELTTQLIFNHFDLQRMLIGAELSFTFTSMAYGLLFMSIILTLFATLNKI